MVKGDNTFNTSFTICTPSDDLIPNITFSINNNHRYSFIWEVGYTFVADDGDEFGAWMPAGEDPNMLKCTVAVRNAEEVGIKSSYCANKRRNHPSLYKKQTTPVPNCLLSSSSLAILASVTSFV